MHVTTQILSILKLMIITAAIICIQSLLTDDFYLALT